MKNKILVLLQNHQFMNMPVQLHTIKIASKIYTSMN